MLGETSLDGDKADSRSRTTLVLGETCLDRDKADSHSRTTLVLVGAGRLFSKYFKSEYAALNFTVLYSFGRRIGRATTARYHVFPCPELVHSTAMYYTALYCTVLHSLHCTALNHTVRVFTVHCTWLGRWMRNC